MFQDGLSKFVKPLLFILIFTFFAGCNSKDNSPTDQNIEITSNNPMITSEIKIGFCPTMTGTIQDLKQKGIDFKEIPYGSSSAAITALHNGQVEAIVIGRSANASELSDDLRFIRQQDGYTLISNRSGLILIDDLVKVVIHTAESQNIAQDLLPPSTHIIYYEDLGDALALINNGAVLLHWSQVQPDDKLLIPIDSFGNKIQSFRSPHLYYKDSNSHLLTILIEKFTP